MRFLGAFLCIVGVIFLKGAMGGSGSNSAFYFRTITEDLKFSATLFFIGLALLVIGRSSTRFSMLNDQEYKDTNATLSFEINDFSGRSLFLRPFKTDGGFVIQSSFEHDYGIVGQKSLMRTIADAVEPTCPLLAVGERGGLDFSFGATGQRLNDWQQKISIAIETADLIILIPGADEGVIWEVGEIIKQEALSRTLFIMPPLYGSENWKKTTDKINHHHQISLPKHTIYGAIFTFSNVEELKSFQEIDDKFLESPFRAATLINKVLQ